MKQLFIFLITLQSFFGFGQVKKKILFIGNSYTYANNLPQLVADIALSKSDTVVFDSNTPGGYTFQMHCSNSITQQKIKSQKWDVVILQAQSQEPSLDPLTVQSQTYPYAKQLCDSIRANNACTEVMFYMTWGRKNSDIDNCPTYTPSCSYVGMQARLRESYMLFKDSFMTSVAPVGVAWKTFRNSYPLVDLYVSDESHPSLHGSYLAACVFYSSIFKKTTVGSIYNPSLPVTDVNNIQTIASKTVLDSVDLWNLGSQFPTANFSYTNIPPYTCQFTNLSKNATSFLWSFGNTTPNPIYTFPSSGTYTVTLKSSNGCASDSLQKLISLAGINEMYENDKPKIFCYDNKLTITNSKTGKNFGFTLFSMDGREIATQNNLKNEFNLDLSQYPSGIYLVKYQSKEIQMTKKIVINTY